MKNNKGIAAWKVYAAKKYLELKDKVASEELVRNIVEQVQIKYPNSLTNDKETAWNRVYDFINRSKAFDFIVNALNQGIPSDSIVGKTPVQIVKEAGGAITKMHSNPLTTAHINDDDKTEETEEEIVAIQSLVEAKTNKDGSYSVTVDFKNETIPPNEILHNEVTLLEKLGYDPAIWEVVTSSCRAGEWDVQTKDGEIKKLYSYRINANVKKREGSICSELLLEAFEKKLAERPSGEDYQPIEVEGENIAIFSIADLHLGKLAWVKEVGESYDYKICRERFFYVVNKAITSMKKIENLEKVIFFWSQDFFHYDNLKITTTAGTQQDTDIRWQKLYEIGCDMLVDAIQLISDSLGVPVQTFYTRSNHDMQVSYYALNFIYAWFRNNPNIEVNRDPIGRKYVEYGINLMGFGHGDEEGRRIHNIMQVEQPQAWGRTLNHEWFLGHFHKLMMNDEAGVRATYLSSVTGTDAWHYNSGYIGAFKQAQVHIRNKYEGPVGVIDINVVNN